MLAAVRAAFIAGLFFLLQILGEGGTIMMAMLMAQRVILGKTAFADVPATLKPAVRELLVDAGVPELAVEE